MPPRPPFASLVSVVLLAGACSAAAPPPEVAVPASEPREVLRFEVDLRRGQRCEEAFDLALYQDRGIELIEWDKGPRCEGRVVAVRYLPRRTTPENIFRAVEQAGGKVTRSTQVQGGSR